MPPLRRDDPQSKADLARGLRINFYQVADPLLLASWTSFFRDQYLATNGELQQKEGSASGGTSCSDTSCRVGSFVLRLNQFQILESEAFKRLYRQYPLMLTPVSPFLLSKQRKKPFFFSNHSCVLPTKNCYLTNLGI